MNKKHKEREKEAIRIAKEKRQMDIKDKIIDKYGYSDIFTVDGSGNTDYNAIKNNIQIKTRRP